MCTHPEPVSGVGRYAPSTNRPGQYIVEASVATDDGAIDLGAQRTVVRFG
jgi:hypothetical protein